MAPIRGRGKFSHFRAHPRIKKRIELTFPSDAQIVHAMTVDIGLGGVFIATDVVLARGTSVELSFRLPGRKDPLVLPGIVRWVNDGSATANPDDDRPSVRGMGISFADAPPGAILALSEFLTADP